MLGDMAFDLEALEMISKLPGIKHLILGNHDKEKKRNISIQNLVNAYHDIHGFMRYKEFWLSHCPIHFDELRGRYLVHGHTHNHLINDPRYLNVCLEQTDYKPISLEQVRLIFESRKEEIEKITNV